MGVWRIGSGDGIPGPEIIPSEIGGGDQHVLRDFHEGVIDRYGFKQFEDLGCGSEIAFGEVSGDISNFLGDLGLVILEFAHECCQGEEEHAAVPEEVARPEELGGDF